MAQHDYVIANQGAVDFRNDINNALLSMVSQNAGATAPSTTFAQMMWYDSTNDLLKMRNDADDAWITLFKLDETNDLINHLDLIPQTDNTEDLGTSSKAWKDLYMQGDLYFDNDNSRTQKHYTWVPLSSGVASASSSIDLTIPSGYDSYKLVLNQVRCANDGVYPAIRLSDDGGSTFKNGATDYTWVVTDHYGGGGKVDSEDNTATQLLMADSALGYSQGNLADELLDGEVMIYGPLNASSKTNIKFFNIHGYNNGEMVYSFGGGRYNTNAATDAVSFRYSGGNITSGTILLYGKTNF